MITIGSYLHRKEFEDLIWRWMHGQVKEDDPETVTKLIHFNSIYTSRYLDMWSRQLFTALSHTETTSVAVKTKAELKDALVSYPHYHNERIDNLIRKYIANRQNYYIETPINAKLFFCGQNMEHRLVGTNRIKRTRRLAEKASRRIIDHIFESIKKKAEKLADLRAEKAGIKLSQLVTPPEQMIREFEDAEKKIVDDLKTGKTLPRIHPSPINDVAGLKIILESEQKSELFDYIETRTCCDVIEIEPHKSEHYNATNLILRCRPKKDILFSEPIDIELIKAMRSRGLWQSDIQLDFEKFVLSGEDDIYMEIIYSSYEDILESEIGLSMHEDRIIDQRQKQQYKGHLAGNIEFLIQYLFTFASFPSKNLYELPIKLWTRYLPDYFEETLRKCYRLNNPSIYSP